MMGEFGKQKNYSFSLVGFQGTWRGPSGEGWGGQIKWYGMATLNSSGQSLLHVHVGLGPQPIVTGNY